MKRIYAILVVGLLFGLLAACSGSDDAQVFDAQTDALDKAEEANRMLEEAAAAQRAAIDRQSQ